MWPRKIREGGKRVNERRRGGHVMVRKNEMKESRQYMEKGGDLREGKAVAYK